MIRRQNGSDVEKRGKNAGACSNDHSDDGNIMMGTRRSGKTRRKKITGENRQKNTRPDGKKKKRRGVAK